MTRVGQRVGGRVGQRVGQVVSATPSYAEDYYLALDQPSQYLRTLSGEITGYDTGHITIAVKLRVRPTAASAGNAALMTLDTSAGDLAGQTAFYGGPNATSMVVAGRTVTNVWAFSPGVDRTDAGVRVYILHTDRAELTYRQVQAAAGSVVSQSGASYTGTLRAAVDAWFGRWSFSTATISQQWVWGAVITALPTDAQVAEWSGGPVSPIASMGAAAVPFFWRADSFDGSACPNEGSGPVAPLSGVNCTIDDRVAA